MLWNVLKIVTKWKLKFLISEIGSVLNCSKPGPGSVLDFVISREILRCRLQDANKKIDVIKLVKETEEREDEFPSLRALTEKSYYIYNDYVRVIILLNTINDY